MNNFNKLWWAYRRRKLLTGSRIFTYTLNIFSANFVRAPTAVEQGLGGSTHRSWYLLINHGGTLRHLYHTHNDGSTSPGVETGINPATFESSLSTSTGTIVVLPAGFVTASARATLIASALTSDPAVTSATVAGSDNANGSRTITVVMTRGATLSLGTRAWADRGTASVWGSHAFRRGVGTVGTADTALTRNIAQAINTPSATARIHAVSIVLGATVSTTAANIPRLYLRSGDASTTIPGPTMLFDFGQLPVSEVVAGRRARINLTPTQVADLRTALNSATGQLWLCVKASATTQNTSLPTGASWNGEFADSSLRVDTVTSGAGNTAAPTSWNNTGATSAASILSMALHYEIDPATNGESYPAVGSLRTLSTAPDEVTLPDTVTRQVPATITGHEGAQLHTLEAQLTDTGVRYGIKGSTDTTDITADTDDPDLSGATTLLDFGLTSTTGTVTMTAPTGDSSIAVPAVFAVEFKGTGLRGFGWLDLPGDNTPIQANDFILGIGGATDGTNQHELDYALESGNPATVFVTPIATAATQPNNLPAMRLTLRRPADTLSEI